VDYSYVHVTGKLVETQFTIHASEDYITLYADCTYHFISETLHWFRCFFFVRWHIRLSGLFLFRISYKIMNLIDIRWDSLDRGSARRKAATYTTQRKQNKCRQTVMPRVGSEPTIQVFERAKTLFRCFCKRQINVVLKTGVPTLLM
jgi:hypothetical protein